MAPIWLDFLDETIQACVTHDRQDLVTRLRERRAQLTRPVLRVLVLGVAGQGKSQLVNALVGAQVCAVGDDVTTLCPAVVEYADTPVAALIGEPATGRDTLADPGTPDSPRAQRPNTPQDAGTPDDAGAGSRQDAPVESATARANRAACEPGTDIVCTRVGLPRALLQAGVALVDTPPAGDVGTRRAVTGPQEILQADAVLLVTDATSELSAEERELLGQMARLCPSVMVVLTKIDMVRDWQHVAERNRQHLSRAGLAAPVVPVSSTLRLIAARERDRELNAESGFDELVHRLRRDWLEQPDLVRRRSVAALAAGALDQLTESLRDEFTTLQQAGSGDAVARWHAAGRELERLQRDTARGQTLLSDEVSDLTSDLEFDLRDRTRRILREAEEYFDVADPARSWQEFAEWLESQLTTVAETNFGWLFDRFDWIARKLAYHLDPNRSDLVPDLNAEPAPVEHAGGVRKPNVEKFSIGQQLFVGMRGSYSGLLMFGLATTVAGMSLVNPISLGAGAAFGLKSVFEERGSRLKRRQAVARTAAHRHVDDFFLACSKQSKDTARTLQRLLRDRYTSYSEQRRAEIVASAKALKQVIDSEAAERNRRARQIKSDLDTIGVLRGKAGRLADDQGRVTTDAPRELTA